MRIQLVEQKNVNRRLAEAGRFCGIEDRSRIGRSLRKQVALGRVERADLLRRLVLEDLHFRLPQVVDRLAVRAGKYYIQNHEARRDRQGRHRRLLRREQKHEGTEQESEADRRRDRHAGLIRL